MEVNGAVILGNPDPSVWSIAGRDLLVERHQSVDAYSACLTGKDSTRERIQSSNDPRCRVRPMRALGVRTIRASELIARPDGRLSIIGQLIEVEQDLLPLTR